MQKNKLRQKGRLSLEELQIANYKFQITDCESPFTIHYSPLQKTTFSPYILLRSNTCFLVKALRALCFKLLLTTMFTKKSQSFTKMISPQRG